MDQLHTKSQLTFAIPFYKGVDYLERTVKSVLAQESADWKLVVCDDSPDASAEAFLHSIRDHRIQYVRNPRTLGMAANWNRCLDEADTELVTILHADDELLPNYAGLMVASASAHPTAAALFCRARVIGPDGTPVFSFQDRIKDYLVRWGDRPLRVAGPDGIASLLRGNYIMCPTVCYRKPIIGDRRFEGCWKFVIDLDFFTRLLARGEELIGIPEYGYAYRRHPDNATAEYTENLLRFEEEVSLYNRLAAEGKVRRWNEVVRVAQQKRMIRLHLIYRILIDVAHGRFAVAETKFDFLRRLTRVSPTTGTLAQVPQCVT